MAEALRSLPKSSDPNLLVGFNHADDAGIYKISESQALVQTVDFFPPIVDDPYWFGQIAAANALSDVYAMGGRPLTALNIVGFPAKMPAYVLTEILRGGAEKIIEAGAVVAGGHSVKDNELKYGVAVTGIIDPNRIISNDGARPGDLLYLTKPIGTGIITTGIKNGKVDSELEELVTKQMAELNRSAAEAMIAADIKSATDITGFGLIGHAYEIAAASNVTMRFYLGELPLLPNVIELAKAMMVPGGTFSNKEYLQEHVKLALEVDPTFEHILYDPQTSGGMLIAVPEKRVDTLLQELEARECFFQLIGRVEEAQEKSIIVE